MEERSPLASQNHPERGFFVLGYIKTLQTKKTPSTAKIKGVRGEMNTREVQINGRAVRYFWRLKKRGA